MYHGIKKGTDLHIVDYVWVAAPPDAATGGSSSPREDSRDADPD